MSYVPFRRTDGRGTRAFHELSRPSDSACRGSSALPRCESRSVDRVSRGRESRREAKCQSAFYSRVIEWGSHGTRTGSFVTTLLMRAGSYAKRITKTPVRIRHKLHDLRTSVAYRRIHFGTHAARWLRAPSPKLHATQPSPRGALGEKLSRRDRERRNVCPSALLADTGPIRLAGSSTRCDSFCPR